MARRRVFLLLLSIAQLALLCAACGGSDGQGDLPRRTTRVLAGVGALPSQQAADEVVLRRYANVPAGRQETGPDGPNGAQVIGQGADESLRDIYAVPGGLLPAGTRVRSAEPETDADTFVLPEPHFLYWVDPMPNADLGHTCFTLYVRASDGRIVEQRNEFDPLVDGARPLEFDAAKREHRLYRHQLWLLTEDALVAPPATRAASGSRDLAAGTTVRTVIIAGTSEARRQTDIDASTSFAKDKLGQSDEDITIVRDQEDDRLTEQDIKDAIKNAAAGLGEDDKLLIILSSHGTEIAFTVGDGFMTWLGLALFLSTEVKAEHVNVILGPCHSGAAVPQFESVQGLSDSRVQVLTSTDAERPAWVYNGLSTPLCLYFEGIGAALDTGNGDDTLTIDEIETAFGSVDLTAAQANEKFLMKYRDGGGLVGQVADFVIGLFTDTFEEDFLKDDGEDDAVRPHGKPQNTVIDGRPQTPAQQPVREVEPNNNCDTSTALDANLTGAGTLSNAGDQDHFGAELDPGNYTFNISPAKGLFLDLPGGGQLSGSGSLRFELGVSGKVCFGVFGVQGTYEFQVTEDD